MPKLIALVDKLPYGKFDHNKGDEFEADDRFANLVIKIGKARLADGASPPNASDLPDEVMSRAAKREPITEIEEPAEVEEVAEVEDAPVVEKAMNAEAVEEDEAPKSQSYHRRDMVAETPKTPLVPNKAIPYPKKRGRPFGKKSQ